jgi:hypothetical protein
MNFSIPVQNHVQKVKAMPEVIVTVLTLIQITIDLAVTTFKVFLQVQM